MWVSTPPPKHFIWSTDIHVKTCKTVKTSKTEHSLVRKAALIFLIYNLNDKTLSKLTYLKEWRDSSYIIIYQCLDNSELGIKLTPDILKYILFWAFHYRLLPLIFIFFFHKLVRIVTVFITADDSTHNLTLYHWANHNAQRLLIMISRLKIDH